MDGVGCARLLPRPATLLCWPPAPLPHRAAVRRWAAFAVPVAAIDTTNFNGTRAGRAVCRRLGAAAAVCSRNGRLRRTGGGASGDSARRASAASAALPHAAGRESGEGVSPRGTGGADPSPRLQRARGVGGAAADVAPLPPAPRPPRLPPMTSPALVRSVAWYAYPRGLQKHEGPGGCPSAVSFISPCLPLPVLRVCSRVIDSAPVVYARARSVFWARHYQRTSRTASLARAYRRPRVACQVRKGGGARRVLQVEVPLAGRQRRETRGAEKGAPTRGHRTHRPDPQRRRNLTARARSGPSNVDPLSARPFISLPPSCRRPVCGMTRPRAAAADTARMPSPARWCRPAAPRLPLMLVIGAAAAVAAAAVTAGAPCGSAGRGGGVPRRDSSGSGSRSDGGGREATNAPIAGDPQRGPPSQVTSAMAAALPTPCAAVCGTGTIDGDTVAAAADPTVAGVARVGAAGTAATQAASSAVRAAKKVAVTVSTSLPPPPPPLEDGAPVGGGRRPVRETSPPLHTATRLSAAAGRATPAATASAATRPPRPPGRPNKPNGTGSSSGGDDSSCASGSGGRGRGERGAVSEAPASADATAPSPPPEDEDAQPAADDESRGGRLGAPPPSVLVVMGVAGTLVLRCRVAAAYERVWPDTRLALTMGQA